MRRSLVLAALALGLAVTPAAAKPDPIPFPICDIDLNCRTCWFVFPPDPHIYCEV